MAKTWGKAFAQPAIEFAPTPLPVLAGQLPTDLRGSYYHNGPGRLERGNQRVGHWFDGDGAIVGIQFCGGPENQATATYRYVQTAGYQREQDADRFCHSNYGMTYPGPLWQRWGKDLKNAANTSVLVLDDRLLALWEGGAPHALDLQSLETHGIDRLGLGDQDAYSAHPKREPHSGLIYNFAVSLGPKPALSLYCHDRRGRLQRRHRHPLEGCPLIHDFVLAGDYLVFCISPVRLNLWPVALQLHSYSESLQWKPELGTELLIFDRHSLTLVSHHTTDPWFQWHYSNGWQDDRGHVVVDLVRYEDFRTNQYLKQVATGQTSLETPARLWRLVLDPKTAQVLDSQPLHPAWSEFPQVSPECVGQAPTASLRGTAFVQHRPQHDPTGELFGAIGYLDPQGKITVTDLGEDRYPCEPIWAGDWLLTLVFDGANNQSELWVWQGDRPGADPVCRLQCPEVIPYGFHGTWAPASPA
ncbi:MAG: carotenoid oxygenase family protein [Prochlorothrix sp.]